MAGGTDVVIIVMCGTEHIYFAINYLNLDGCVFVTVSHSPLDYNGMKSVRTGSRPISRGTSPFDIKDLAEQNKFVNTPNQVKLTKQDISTA